MPNCFTLTRKADPKAGPVMLIKIDTEMCEHFKVPCDERDWYHGWYNVIGFAIACGDTFEKLRAQRKDLIEKCKAAGNTDAVKYQLRMLEIIDWLDENFTTDAWAEIGRR